jgi:H+/Cl- antiporter ClcA
LNTIFSLVAGCAGGMIVPSLSLGALLGSLISEIFDVSSAFMIILCTTSFLSSVIKAPVTAAALIIMFIKPDINIAIYIILTSCLSCYLSFFIKKILGYKAI